jgi:hypothetical protein
MAVEIIPRQGGEWEFRQIGALLESAIPPPISLATKTERLRRHALVLRGGETAGEHG